MQTEKGGRHWLARIVANEHGPKAALLSPTDLQRLQKSDVHERVGPHDFEPLMGGNFGARGKNLCLIGHRDFKSFGILSRFVFIAKLPILFAWWRNSFDFVTNAAFPPEDTLKFAFLIHPISEGTSSLIDLQLSQQLRSAWGQDSLLFCARYHSAVKAAQNSAPVGAGVQPVDAEIRPVDTEVPPVDTEIRPVDTEVRPVDAEVRVVDEIEGVVSTIGGKASGRLYEIPMHPVEFLENPRRALELMRTAVTDASNWGAQVVGLGGLTAIVGSHGAEIDAETDIGVTTGNSLTTFAAVQTVYQICDRLDLDLSQETVAIVGIPGSIAAATAKLLAEKVGRLLLVARTNSGRTRSLAAKLGGELVLDIPTALKQSQVVVTATSSGACIHQPDLRPGAVVIDVAVPTDVVGSQLERDDVLVLSGGQTCVPATFSRDSAFLWFNHGVIPSCLAETIVLALEDRAESFSLGRNLDPEKILEIGDWAGSHGFDFSMLRSFGLPLDDTHWTNVRKVVHRQRMSTALGSERLETNGDRPGKEQHPPPKLTDIAETARAGYARHINPVMTELTQSTDFAKTFVRGEGAYLYDKDGQSYLDFVSGYGAANLGHNHPQIVTALQTALDEQAPGFVQAGINPYAAALADRLAAVAPPGLDMTFFANSGTESVEAALKFARIATGRERFIYCHRSYHGKSLGALSVTGNRTYQRPFEPLLQDCKAIPFDDVDALTETLKQDDFAAFIVEPIQAEGGFHVPADDYLGRAAAACRAAGTLLIVDEVQTGIGRTGKLFAVDHALVRPDVITLAKSLGGGLMPIGAMMCSRALWMRAYGCVQNYMLHTSTFGGGSLACAAGLATLNVMQQSSLLKNAVARGGQLQAGLEAMCQRRRSLREVRGKGLLLGLEFNPMSDAATAHWNQLEETRLSRYLIPNLNSMLDSMSTLYTMQTLLAEHKIFTQVTRSNPLVLRIQPPLMITAAEVRRFLDALDQTIGEMEFRDSSIRDVIAKTGVGRHEKNGDHCQETSHPHRTLEKAAKNA